MIYSEDNTVSSVLFSFCSCGDGIKEAFGKNLFHNIFLASSFTKSGTTA